MTLAELITGQSASIESVNTTAPGMVRLMVLGLVEGTDVKLENTAIGGDPMEFSVYGASISVRREQAGHFRINTISDGD